MNHPIIQAEVDEFEKILKHHDWCSKFQKGFDTCDCGFQKKVDFLSAALHRAVEKSVKETVGDTKENLKGKSWDEYADGYNSCRSLALSKLDTIINFKE